MELSSEQNQYKKVLISYLEKNQNVFLNEWNETIKINEIDPYKEKIKENGYGMYALVIQTFKGALSDYMLTKLAHQVAKERLEANINIGDFLYNINLGRNIIIRNIFGANIPIAHLQEFINAINIHFDTFSYHAVTKYTNLTNDLIEEKKSYISENHKDKLAVLGQISSSFVHEFRNPLTAIMGFNKLLKRENPNLKYLDIIDYELNQLNFRITQFLHTSKSDVNEEQREEISVLKLIEEIQELTYANIVDASVNVEIDIHPNFFITASKDGLKQVFLNLFINSIDALKDKEHPRILRIDSIIEENERIIRISNNGPVIASELIETIFEPFVTTKELGTGIGLYVCKKIIESNDGYMNCESNENATTFSLHFPYDQ
ncbi:histidine kinase N-terminal domain-containing protein [Peribacillus muralis]|uniref:histidine kinase N-terminal domain-containing protein n=1 Tax=Peribacillus muralis TaxID=264697 RepID=UPI000709CED8|nr:histidine kinase N-terminal domain-containing protein [Peribacillus muralis]